MDEIGDNPRNNRASALEVAHAQIVQPPHRVVLKQSLKVNRVIL